MGGNIRCRKVSPCSTWAKGNMCPRLARLRLREAALHSAPLRVTFDRSSSLLSMPVRLALLGNGHGPRGAAVWSAPPSMPHYHAAGGVAPSALTRVPPAVMVIFTTILQQSLSK